MKNNTTTHFLRHLALTLLVALLAMVQTAQAQDKTISLGKDNNGNYLIQSVADLNTLATYVNEVYNCSGMTFVLGDNINFNPTPPRKTTSHQ